MRMPIHENLLLNNESTFYVTIIVSIVHQILPCKICSKKNSKDHKSKKHPNSSGFMHSNVSQYQFHLNSYITRNSKYTVGASKGQNSDH